MIDQKLNSVIGERIVGYRYYPEDENGEKDKESESRNTEVLELLFDSGKSLKINTFCSGSAENTSLIFS